MFSSVEDARLNYIRFHVKSHIVLQHELDKTMTAEGGLRTGHVMIIFMELTAQKGKGDRGKRTSDRAQIWDLCSIAEFQPREPQRPVEILLPSLLLCTGHRTLKTCTSRLVLCAM